jgi:predicted CXXCH cytochrome family protein
MAQCKQFAGSTVVTLFLFFPVAAWSQEIDCLTCHEELKKQKVVHAALEMGCTACHTGIDAKSVPHSITGTLSKGLSADPPGLCFGCHDKAPFTLKKTHAALGMGCTSCHNPHSSSQAKLLVSEPPEVCFACHDRSAFSHGVVHPPVADGLCLSCHNPHASDQPNLLIKKPYELCLDCHADIVTKPHGVSGISSSGHPLGGPGKKNKSVRKRLVKDLKRGKEFYCGSCHDPHSTDTEHLFRFNAKSSMALCTNCHVM